MKALRELCGGSPVATSKLASVQNILGREIERYGEAVSRMLKGPTNDPAVGLYGCFAARKMLEAGCVAVLSRLDPSRILILREFQLRGRYALDERHPASIDWAGDIISEKKAAWTDGVAPDKFVRSLLGGHLAEASWLPAIEALIKLSSQQVPLGESAWINELVEQYEHRKASESQKPVVPRAGGEPAKNEFSVELGTLAGFRTSAKQAFSTLSKGVHLEFVVEQEALFDNPTVLVAMRKATKVLTQIAFVSHLVESAFTVIDPANAIKLVCDIEKEIE